MVKLSYTTFSRFLLVLFMIFLGRLSLLYGQCDFSKSGPPAITSVTTTPATCPNNGTITINVDPNTGGGEYIYEISAGPVIRLPQSQNVFQALAAGDYTIKVYGCIGLVSTINATIDAQYFDLQLISSVYSSVVGSFQCGILDDAKIYYKFQDVPLSQIDLIRTPLGFQITTSTDPVNGFVGIPITEMDLIIDTVYQDGVRLLRGIGLLTNTATSGDYLVRIYDQCENFITLSVNVPEPQQSPSLDFRLKLEQGYSRYLNSPDNVRLSECGVMGALFIYDEGSNDYIPYGSMPVYDNLPFHIVVRNGNTNAVLIDEYRTQSDYNQNFSDSVFTFFQDPSRLQRDQGGYPQYYDHFPFDTPIVLEVTDACGATYNYTHPGLTQESLAFTLCQDCDKSTQDSSFVFQCAVTGYYYPATVKVYEMPSNDLIFDDTLQVNHSFPPGSINQPGGYLLEIGKTYRWVMESCGEIVEQTHTVTPTDMTTWPTPTFDVTEVQHLVTCETENYARVTITHTNPHISTNANFELISGPMGLDYPIPPSRCESGSSYVFESPDNAWGGYSCGGIYDVPSNNRSSFLVAGTYDLRVQWGCGQEDTLQIIVPPFSPDPFTYELSLGQDFDPCNGRFITASESASGPLPDSIRYVITFPDGFFEDFLAREFPPYYEEFYLSYVTDILNSDNLNEEMDMYQGWEAIDISFILPDNPFEVVSATYSGTPFINISNGSLDIDNVWTLRNPLNGETEVFPNLFRLEFQSIYNVMINNPSLMGGTYTIDYYGGGCDNEYIGTTSVSLGGVAQQPVNLGLSSALMCNDGTAVIVANASGGTEPYMYQYKENDPAQEFSPLSTENVYTLPNGTPIGQEYIVRVVDACGNSYSGYFVINSLSPNFFIIPVEPCVGETANLYTMNLPYTTYSWSGPNGAIAGDTSSIFIEDFQPTDFGTYTVEIDMLNGCFTTTATYEIDGNTCILLPIDFISFEARKDNLSSILTWNVGKVGDVNKFEVERLGVNRFGRIGEVLVTSAQSDGKFSYIDYSPQIGTNFYRIKAIGHDGKENYSKVRSVEFGENKYSINPIPATNYINVVTPNNVMASQLDIYNMQGSLVKSFVNTNKLNIHDLSSGVYVLKVYSKNSSQELKFIKE